MNKEQILKLLTLYENKSNCPKRQVAAIIVPQGLLKHNWLDTRLDLIQWGANTRVLPYTDTRCERCLEGYKGSMCPAIHAEAQCLMGMSFSDTVTNTLMISWSPCPECCKLIKAAEIARVIIKEPRLKRPSVVDCFFYKVSTYDELSEKLLPGVEYIRLWEQDEDWQVQ